jgi:hypothetical protein
MNVPAVAAFFSSCREALAGHQKQVRSAVATFFASVGPVLAAHQAAQLARDRTEASAFNVFQWIKPDENRLSDIFAHLLDAEGEHGQGALFLEELLLIAGVSGVEGLDQAQAWLEEGTWLIDNPLRRIDITVDFPPQLQFGIGIENKPWASDQIDQVADYVKHMERRYPKGFLFFYWSGDGRPPPSLTHEQRENLERQNRLRVWSYQREVREWLEKSRRGCQAAKVSWFLTDLLGYLGKNFVDKSSRFEEEE